jgi:hypothetical protein
VEGCVAGQRAGPLVDSRFTATQGLGEGDFQTLARLHACTPGAVLRPAGNAYHRQDERLPSVQRPASSAAVGGQLRALQRLLALCRAGFLVVRGRALPGWDGTSPGLAAHSKARSRPGSTPPFVLLVRAGAPQLPLAQCPSSWLSPRTFHFLSKASLLGPAFSLSLAHCTL